MAKHNNNNIDTNQNGELDDLVKQAFSEAESNEQVHEEKNDVSNEALMYLEMAQRLKADFDNYKKRNAELAENSFNSGVSYSVEKILPVVDSITNAKNKITDPSVIEGLDIIATQLFNSLKSLGVEKIESVGKEFDPNLHNAVMVDKDSTLPDQQVLEEFQMGFMLGNKVIRHSVVKINKLS